MGELLLYRRFLMPYRGRIALLAVLIVVSTLLEGLGLGLFYPLVEYIQQGESFLRHGAAARVFGPLTAWGVRPSVGLFIGSIFAVIVVTLALRFLVYVLSARVSDPLMKDMRDEAFHRVLHSHLFCFHESSSGALAQTLENEVWHLGRAFNFVALIASNAASMAVYGGFVLFMSWKLTALVGGLAALRYSVSSIFLRRTRRLGEEHGELHSRLKSYVISIYQGIDVIKSFGTEDREEASFKRLTKRIGHNADARAVAAAGTTMIEGLLGDGLMCLIIYLAVSRLQVSGAALLTFLFVIMRIIPKVSAINDSRILIHEYLAGIKNLPTILTGPGLPSLRWGKTLKLEFNNQLAFERVGFTYPGGDAPALREVNLTLRHNETLAVVGESGSGKTTLARLLLRLFDPTSGRITVDGIPLPELRREDWTRLVGVVSQDTFIFDDTVENNVKYGAPSSSEVDFRRALERARATEFIEALPEKEKTVLGERGVRLSGGQRQRIAIARAFLRDAPILILDEATSAMDAVTEKLIQEAIKDLAKGRTMLIIAHRFTTIRDADRIVVLEKGRVAESGTHAELVARGELYHRFHELQSR